MLLAPKIQPKVIASDWSEASLVHQLKGLLEHYKHASMTHGPLWQLAVQPSRLPNAGSGVFLVHSDVLPGTLLTLYPGSIYESTDPIFFPSLYNAYILRLSNGTFIDGKNSGLSKWIYSSLASRDYNGRTEACDKSWLKHRHPYGLGQLVNHGHQLESMTLYEEPYRMEPNVSYTEMVLTRDNFDLTLLPYLPNIKYQNEVEHETGQWSRRLVGLVATRTIRKNEELLSSYLSIST